MSPHLILPNVIYIDSYINCCKEAGSVNMKYNGFRDTSEEGFASVKWISDIMKTYYEYRKGIALPEGHVPATEFWMIEHGAVTGVGVVRHCLNADLLRLGGHIGYSISPSKQSAGRGTVILGLLINEAAKLGIKRALLTCNETNAASSRVIEKNNALHQDTIPNIIEGEAIRTKRYWIKTGA